MTNSNNKNKKDKEAATMLQLFNNDEITTKVYKIRWFILGMFMFYTALTTFQFVEYSIITNVITRYYNVAPLAVNWTAMSFMLFHIILAYPANYLSNKIGLRWSTILGNILNVMGTWIKFYSVSPDKFYMTFIGQCLVATTQAFILSGPGAIAAQWFPSSETLTATSLCLMGNLIGLSAGFFVMPMMVRNHENLSDIGTDLSRVFLIIAILSTISLIFLILFFKDEPKIPPTVTRSLQKSNNKRNNEDGFIKPMKRLLANKSFIILCNSYGLNMSVVNAFSTLLNQLILSRFQNAEKDAGRIGLSIIVSGMLGSVVCSLIVDKTQKFKITTMLIYFLIFCGQILISVALLMEIKWMVYMMAIFLGWFSASYLSLGYEMCAEFTYPVPEAMSNAILNIVHNIYGIVLLLILDKLLLTYGDISIHITLCSVLLIGFIMTVLTKDKHKRKDARNALMHQSLIQANKIVITANT